MKLKETLTLKVANKIQNELLNSREISPGEYLPAERDLAKQFKVSRVTIRQSLKKLTSKGLLDVVPYKGYRFIKPMPDKKDLGSLAYLVNTIKPNEPLDKTSEQIIAAFNRILLQQNQQMLSMGIKDIEANDSLLKKLKISNVKAIALDCDRPDFVDAASQWDIPCVLIDSYTQNNQMDIILQENFNGAFKAVEYLIKKNHKKIVWVGPTKGTAHSRERFSGARAAMENHDMEFCHCYTSFSKELKVETKETENFVANLLKQKSPPTAFICMWQPLAMSVVDAIKKSKFKLGQDIDIIGWTTENEYRDQVVPEFLNEMAPASMIWSPNEMASTALEMLERRINKPEAPFIRVEIKAHLQQSQEANKILKSKHLV